MNSWFGTFCSIKNRYEQLNSRDPYSAMIVLAENTQRGDLRNRIMKYAEEYAELQQRPTILPPSYKIFVDTAFSICLKKVAFLTC